MNLKYKNQHGEVIREEKISQAYSEKDINVFFSFGNELDTINKRVKVISNVKKPEAIYTLKKGVTVKTLMACGLSKSTAKNYMKQKYFSRKTTKFVTWKKINHLLDPLAIEKHVLLDDGRIVKYKDYESFLLEQNKKFLVKPNGLVGLEDSLKKLSEKLGYSYTYTLALNRQDEYFSTGDSLYLYLLKKNKMDIAIIMDDDLYKRFLAHKKKKVDKN